MGFCAELLFFRVLKVEGDNFVLQPTIANPLAAGTVPSSRVRIRLHELQLGLLHGATLVGAWLLQSLVE